MAKVLFNGPLNKDDDWGKVSRDNGNPASGSAVQEYIKREFANRFGYLKYLESDGKYHLFTDEAGYEAWRKGETVLHASFDAPKPASIRFVDGKTSPFNTVNILGQKGNTFYFNYLVYNNGSEQYQVEPVTIRITITRDGELIKTITDSPRVINAEDAINPAIGTNYTFTLDDYFLYEGAYEVTVVVTGNLSGATATQIFSYDIVNLKLQIVGYPTTVLPYDTTYFDVTYLLTGGSDTRKRIQIYVDGEPLYQSKLSGINNRVDTDFEAGSTGIISLFTRKGNTVDSELLTWPTLGSEYGEPTYELVNGELTPIPSYFTNAELAGKPVFDPGKKHNIQFRAWIPKNDRLSSLEAYRIYSVTQYIELAIADDSGEEQVYILYNGGLDPGTLFNQGEPIKVSMQQYLPMTVNFTPVNSNPANKVVIDWELDNGVNSSIVRSEEYASGEPQEFEYTMNDFGSFTLNALNNDDVKLSLELSVEEFSSNGQKIEESQVNSLFYKYSAENRSNSEKDGGYRVWKNTTTAPTAALYQADVIFNNFPETFTERCGWSNNALVLSDGATITIPVDIFSNFNRDLGLTFEIDFETANVLDDETVIMDYSADGESTFIKLTATEASTWAKTMPFSDHLKTNYKDSTRNKIAFTFNPTSNLGRESAISIDPNVDYQSNRYYGALDNPNLIFIYVNGVLDRASRWGNGNQYSDTVVWSNEAAKQRGFTIGDPAGKATVKIYSIRIYGMALNPEEEFMNYLTDSGENKKTIFEKNDIYNSSNEISFESVKKLIPTLLLSADYSKINGETTEGKKNNYQYELQYFDPNTDQKYLGFYVRNGWISCQGTSSMAYPTKNLRPYFNKIVNKKTQPKTYTALSEGTGDITSIGISTTPSFATEFWPYELYGEENENNVSSWVDGNISVTYAEGNSGKTFDVSFDENGPQLPYATNGKEMYQSAYKKEADFAGKKFVNVTTGKELTPGVNKEGKWTLFNNKGKEVKLEKRYYHEIGGDRPHDVAMALAKYYNEHYGVQLFTGTAALNDADEMEGKFEPAEYSDSHNGKYYMDAYHTWVKPGFEVDTDKYDLYLKQLRYSGMKIFERIAVYDEENNFVQYLYTKAKALDRTLEYFGLGAYWRQYDGYGDTNNSGWTDRWTLKADFAESSMCHNAGVGRLWGNAMKNVLVGGEAVCKTDAQDNVEKYTSNTGYGKKGFDVRTSCDGKPVVLFVKQEQAFDISTGKAGFGPIKYGGIFNIMTDKSSTKLFGFETIKDENNDVVFSAYSNEDGDDPHKGTHNRVQCYEFLQNGSNLATGLSLKFDDKDKVESYGHGDKIGDGRPLFVDFESRFPDTGQERHEGDNHFPDDAYGVETNDFESFWRWVNFCKDAIKYNVDGDNDGYTMSQYRPITWEQAQAKFEANPDKFVLILKYVALGNEHYVENGGGNGAEKDTWIDPFTGNEEVPNLDLTKEDPGYIDTYYEFIENINYENVVKTVRTETIADSGYQHVYRGKVKCFDSKYRVDHNADDAEEKEAEYGVWAYLKLNNGRLYYTNEFDEPDQPYDANWTGQQVTIDDYETINVGTENEPEIVDASTLTFMDYFSKTKYQHLAVYKVAAYYIYITRFAGVDQVVKNSMMTTENGEQWYFINYDNDTILGVRNDAVLAFNWDVNRDFFDKSKNNYAYAGSKSVLWNNLEMDDDFMSIVKEIDRAMFAQELLSKQTVLEYFNEKQMGSWCERLYNKQEDVKYLSTFKQDFGQIRYLVFLQGNRSSHRTWWVNKRWDLYDSLWESGLYDKQYISFKSNIPEARETKPGYVCTFTATSKYRFKAIRNTRLMDNVELGMNETYNLLTKQELAEGDPVYLRGAQKMNVLSFRNGPEQLVELIMVEQFEYQTEGGQVTRTSDWVQESGTTMLKLLIGNGTKDAAFKTFSGYDKITSIEDFDIRRCVNISPSVASLSNLHRFRASGSGLTSFAPHRGAVLYEVSLPASIGELNLNSTNFVYQSPNDYVVYQKGKTPVDDSLPYEENEDRSFKSGVYTDAARRYTAESGAIFDYVPTARLNSIVFDSVKGFDTLKFIQDWVAVVNNPANKLTAKGIDWKDITVDEFIQLYEQLGEPEIGVKFSGTVKFINNHDDKQSVISQEDYRKLVNKFGVDIFRDSSALQFVADEQSIFISATNEEYVEKPITAADTEANDNLVEGCNYYEVVNGESITFTSTVFPKIFDEGTTPRIVVSYFKDSASNIQRVYNDTNDREVRSESANVTVNYSGNTVTLKLDEERTVATPVYRIDVYLVNSETGRRINIMTNPSDTTMLPVFVKVVNKTFPVSNDFKLTVTPANDGDTIDKHTATFVTYDEKKFNFYYENKTAKLKSVEIKSGTTLPAELKVSGITLTSDKKGFTFTVNRSQINDTYTTTYEIPFDIKFDTDYTSNNFTMTDFKAVYKSIKISKLVFWNEENTAPLDGQGAGEDFEFKFDNGGKHTYPIKLVAATETDTPNIPINTVSVDQTDGEDNSKVNITVNDKDNTLVIDIRQNIASASETIDQNYLITYKDIFGNEVYKRFHLLVVIEYVQRLVLKRQDYENSQYNTYIESNILRLANAQGTDYDTYNISKISDNGKSYLEYIVVAEGRSGKLISEPCEVSILSVDIPDTTPDVYKLKNILTWNFESSYSDASNNMTGKGNLLKLTINHAENTNYAHDEYDLIITAQCKYDLNKDREGDELDDTITTTFTVKVSHSLANSVSYKGIENNALYLVDSGNGFYKLCDWANNMNEVDYNELNDNIVELINNSSSNRINFVGLGIKAGNYPLFMSLTEELQYNFFAFTDGGSVDEDGYHPLYNYDANYNTPGYYNGYEITQYLLDGHFTNETFINKLSNGKVYIPSSTELQTLFGNGIGNQNTHVIDYVLNRLKDYDYITDTILSGCPELESNSFSGKFYRTTEGLYTVRYTSSTFYDATPNFWTVRVTCSDITAKNDVNSEISQKIFQKIRPGTDADNVVRLFIKVS